MPKNMLMNSLVYKQLKSILFFLIIFFSLIFSACKKKDTLIQAETVENEIEFLEAYSSEEDDYSWIDSLIENTIEEIAAEKLEAMQEIQSIIDSPYSILASETDFVEKRLTDSQNNLKIMEYGEEIFTPSTIDGKLVLVHKFKENVWRIFYDENYRLVKKEIWQIKTASDAKKISTEEYDYSPVFENRPVRKKITQDKDSSELKWTYDSEGRIIIEEEIIVKSSVKKTKMQKYYFNEDEQIPPGYEYWEDGSITLKKIYSSKNDYYVQTFLEDDFSVITYYNDNKKTKEEYFLQNEIVRVREY